MRGARALVHAKQDRNHRFMSTRIAVNDDDGYTSVDANLQSWHGILVGWHGLYNGYISIGTTLSIRYVEKAVLCHQNTTSHRQCSVSTWVQG